VSSPSHQREASKTEGEGERKGERERDKKERGNMGAELGNKSTWNGEKSTGIVSSFICEFHL